MLTRKLTVVVTCTERKRVTPSDELRVRSLPAGSLPERAGEWQQRIVGANDQQHPLTSLYAGEAWVQTHQLLRVATQQGWRPRLFVASAGLGMRPVEAHAPAYAATFASSHPDSVVSDPASSPGWWARLSELPGAASTADLPNDPVLLVLSAAYAAAMRLELQDLAASGREALVIGGSEDIPGMHRLPSDRNLRHVLGGTTTSINQRMAAQWLQISSGPGLHTAQRQHAWERWAAASRRDENYGRTTQSDDQVLKLIQRLRSAHPGISRSAALRTLRHSGWACEQQRFARLFEIASEAA